MPFKFNIDIAIEQLMDYVNSVDSYKKEPSKMIVNPEFQTYGLKTYDKILDYLDYIVQESESIDIRIFHTLWEHKKCLEERIKYLSEYYTQSVNFQQQIESLKYRTLQLKNLGLKYKMTKNNSILQHMKEIITDIKNQESTCLKKYLTDLYAKIN